MSDELPLHSPLADDLSLIRDALRHLHDFVALQRHPLAGRGSHGATDPAARGRDLRRLLLESIAALEPSERSPDPKATLRHRLGEMVSRVAGATMASPGAPGGAW